MTRQKQQDAEKMLAAIEEFIDAKIEKALDPKVGDGRLADASLTLYQWLLFITMRL